MPPPRVGPYRIERLLGHGGLGSVHVARDAQGRTVALKTLPLDGPEASELAQAFEREVALHRRLDHPDIVRILDAGRAGDLAFIAMEFVAGGDLARALRPGAPLPTTQALGIAARLAAALAHAHAAGIVHRDLKPPNVLLDSRAGVVKLSDFGLARLADLQRSRTGVLAGTPAYMSPEQLADADVDARTDLYALGVVLYEMLAGRLPHATDSLGALLREVATREAPPLASLRPDLPAELSHLVAALLAKERRQRPHDAAAVAVRLAALAAAQGA
ncbi:MAG: serine/threonine protein kinase [Rubrivivax sp.]|nr:serine/threonine protein kinase [Rubrivivax sp.]